MVFVRLLLFFLNEPNLIRSSPLISQHNIRYVCDVTNVVCVHLLPTVNIRSYQYSYVSKGLFHISQGSAA